MKKYYRTVDLTTFLKGFLIGILIIPILIFWVPAQSKSTPKKLTLFREFKDSFADDITDDGSLLIMRAQTKERGKGWNDRYRRTVEIESGREIDRVELRNGYDGWVGFLPNTHKVLFTYYKNPPSEVFIRDVETKKDTKCTIPKSDFTSRSIFFFDSDRAIVTFSGGPDGDLGNLYLLTLPDCSLKQIGEIQPDTTVFDARNKFEGLTPISLRDKRFFAIRVSSRHRHTIAIWDMSTNKVIKWIGPPFPLSVEWDGYTPDGRFLIANGMTPGKEFVNKGKVTYERGKPYIRLYDTDRYEVVTERELVTSAGATAFSPDGKYMALIYNNINNRQFIFFDYVEPTVELYDAKTWDLVAIGTYPRYPYIWDRTFPVLGGIVRFTTDSKYLITTPDYTRVWLVP